MPDDDQPWLMHHACCNRLFDVAGDPYRVGWHQIVTCDHHEKTWEWERTRQGLQCRQVLPEILNNRSGLYPGGQTREG